MSENSPHYATEKPARVEMAFTWDESFNIVRAVESRIAQMEGFAESFRNLHLEEDLNFWLALIEGDKAILEKVERFRLDAVKKGW